MFGDEGYWLTRAGSHSRQEDGLKPGLERIAIHRCTRLGEVREGTCLTWGLKAQGLLGCANHGYGDLVDPRGCASQYQGDAVLRFHSFGTCSGSRNHHVGSSYSRSDLLISSVRRRNSPGNRPTAQPSSNGRRGSRQSPGGNFSPKHSWFYQTATGTSSPLSMNPSPTRAPPAEVAAPNVPNR